MRDVLEVLPKGSCLLQSFMPRGSNGPVCNVLEEVGRARARHHGLVLLKRSLLERGRLLRGLDNYRVLGSNLPLHASKESLVLHKVVAVMDI